MAVTVASVRLGLGEIPSALISDNVVNDAITDATALVTGVASADATTANKEIAIKLYARYLTYYSFMINRQIAEGSIPEYGDEQLDRLKAIFENFLENIVKPEDVEEIVATIAATTTSVLKTDRTSVLGVSGDIDQDWDDYG